MTSRSLRQKQLGRVMVDQITWRLPLGLYKRLNLERWLTPRPMVPDSVPEPVTRESRPRGHGRRDRESRSSCRPRGS